MGWAGGAGGARLAPLRDGAPDPHAPASAEAAGCKGQSWVGGCPGQTLPVWFQ